MSAASDAEQMITTVKSYVVDMGADQQPTARASDYDVTQQFALALALSPPVDPKQLAIIYRLSSVLRPCVEAIATNVDGSGYQLEPIIDLQKKDVAKLVREALVKDRLAQGNAAPPTDAEVEECRLMIERGQLDDEMRLTRFLEYVCPDKSFVDLRLQTRIEQQGTGNAFWEMTRDAHGQPCYADRVEQHSVRLRRVDPDFVWVNVKQRRSPIAYEECCVPRRFRTYVQLSLGVPAVFFKEWGDPRVMSSRTGRWFEDEADLMSCEGDRALPAAEMQHWRVFDALGPYGLPTWYAAQFAVLGTLYSERVNHDLFNNKAIPPMAIFVSGGKLAEGAVARLKEHIAENVIGQANWHKILILEAEGAGGANGSRCKIEIQSLMSSQQKDQLFQEYEANNFKKVKRQWRLPDLLVGESQEVNRAQAEAALQMAEQQVFQPLREAFDAWVNRFLLPELGIVHLRFKTNSPVAKDPSLQTELGTDWMKAGVLTPNEGRVIAGEVFNREFPPIEEPWASVPQPLALAGILPGRAEDGKAVPAEPESVSLAQQMIALRDTLREDGATGAAVSAVKKRMVEATRVVKMPDAEFDALFEKQ